MAFAYRNNMEYVDYSDYSNYIASYKKYDLYHGRNSRGAEVCGVPRRLIWYTFLVGIILAIGINVYLYKYVLKVSTQSGYLTIPTPSPIQMENYLSEMQDTLHELSTDHEIRQVNLTKPYEQVLSTYGASGKLYGEFTLAAPTFPSSDPRFYELFWNNKKNTKALYYSGRASRRGVVAVIPNGFFSVNHICNTSSSLLDFVKKPPDSGEIIARRSYVLPLNDIHTPCSMAALVTDFLPRLAQVRQFLMIEKLTIMVHGTCDTIARQILEYLGLKVIYYSKTDSLAKNIDGFTARFQINSCIVPKLQPELLGVAQHMLGVNKEKVSEKTSKVTLVLRLSPTLRGRTIHNRQAIEDVLKDRFSDVAIFDGSNNLNDVRATFENSRVFIGPHGPALYNIIFAPPRSHIVEVFSTNSNGRYYTDWETDRVNDIWRLAQSLGHMYYRMLETPYGYLGGMTVKPKNMEYMVDTLMSDEDIG